MEAPPAVSWHVARQGISTQERPLVLKVSGSKGPGALDTLIVAVFHGDEPESMALAEAFWERYITGALMLPTNRRVGVISCLNPDGLAHQCRTTTRGVDLNRNFPTKDWREAGQDTPYYSGPSSASEPETRFLLSVLTEYAPKKVVTIHTPYNVLNFDGPAEALSEAMAACNHMPVETDIGYPTPGSFGTYLGKERHVPVVTLELPEGPAFTPEVKEQNIAALVAAVQFSVG